MCTVYFNPLHSLTVQPLIYVLQYLAEGACPLQVACRDFPHARHLCVHFPFKTSLHVKYCTQVSISKPIRRVLELTSPLSALK
jgi:hypothetical protein